MTESIVHSFTTIYKYIIEKINSISDFSVYFSIDFDMFFPKCI